MNHSYSPWKLAALALVLVAPASLPASAQSQHLAVNSMSASDQTVLREHHADLAEAARIYGYNLATGNWSYEQTLCLSMPDTVLLHYTRHFPDGAESLFTALVPRGAGHVRIVPVLYRGATPFVPAPKNSSNYALFNELIANAGAAQNRFDLGACYAEMTGGNVDLRSGPDAGIGVAGAPSPRIQIDPKDKTARVTLSTREGVSAYRVWSISFNRKGRVTAVSAEDQSAATARVRLPATANTQTRSIAQRAASPATESAAAQASEAPGWKYIPQAPDPPQKIVAPAPPPLEKVIPEPPNPWKQSGQSPQ